MILFAGRLSPGIEAFGAGGGVEGDLSSARGAATPAAATEGYSVAAAAGDGDGSDG